MVGIGQLEGLGVEILVGHAPGILEVDIRLGHAALVDHAVAIAAEEGIHVVEVAASAINEHAVIALRRELLAEAGIAAFTTDPLDDGASRGGRYGQGDGFQAAIGAGARGVKVVEEQALLAQRIEVGGQATWVAKTAKVLGRQALDGHQNNIQLACLAWVIDLPADVQWVAADEATVRLVELFTQAFGNLCVGQGGIELRVVQLVVTERSEELVGAVAGQFMLVGVAAQAARAVLIEQHQTQGGADKQRGACTQAGRTVRQWCLQSGLQRLVQGQRQQCCYSAQGTEQPAQRIGLQQVVEYLIGVHQVVHGDEVEAHAELIPEQPFGRGDEQHGVQTDQKQAAQ